ncbi:MAG TPA: long-chain fatty acid--CoA ligase [Gemmatimonadales bacterium]|nr:long-chain fatty acid--CoA ligase [Gemmatimonadales bacterium]
MADPRTLNEIFFGALDTYAGQPALLRAKRHGAWYDINAAALGDMVQDVSAALVECGMRAGDRVAILSENRPEWAVADYACLALGVADVPIYPTLPAKQIEYILRDSGAAVIFVSSQQQLAKVQEIRSQLPALRHVIAFDEDATGTDVMPWGEFAARGRAAKPKYPRWREEALAVPPSALATVIYTSGTTGDPKGVMLSHGNITSNVVASLSVLGISSRDSCLSFLPLSHIFERMVGHYTMLHRGVAINYATSHESVAAEMLEVRPTIMAAVPRLYEKIYQRTLETALHGSPLKKRIFFWARRNAEAWVDYTLAHRPAPVGLELRKRVADRLVFAKLHRRTGGRIRFFVSGGAPLNPEIAKFFHAAGLPILEGYGLTETSPVISVNTFERIKLGTVGVPIPGVEVKIAPDGEILTRGPHVMQGYYNKEEATREAIDPEGWFHTGDIGIVDGDGFLRITDRKKDLIVTAGGKNIAPQPIENLAKTSNFVSNAVMLGDKRRFPIMLIVPNLGAVEAWAQHKGLSAENPQRLLALPEVKEKIDREVRKTLRDLAQFEIPKRLVLLPQDFTIESGELTPTLKVRRRVVERKYAAEIAEAYQE